MQNLFSGVFIVGAVAVAAFGAAADVQPLPNAHAHNDYEHPRPLLDALDHGFCGIEADIYLIDGQLLVAHDLEKVDPARTLESLYLKPLHERVTANNGRVYPGGPALLLLIDIKSSGPEAYAALKPLLERYQDMLTIFEDGTVHEKAVTVVLSGASPRGMLKAEKRRLAAIDGRFTDLDGAIDPSLTPLISDSWASTFKWNRSGPMPEDIRAKVKVAVDTAHRAGAKVRFWATPHREDFWEALLDCGVDYINADDLERLGQFLTNRRGPK